MHLKTNPISGKLGGALVAALMTSLLTACAGPEPDGAYWQMHTIDNSLSGADGVDLFDIEHDGDLDAVVGWEESGEVMLYENPGPGEATDSWTRTSISGGLDNTNHPVYVATIEETAPINQATGA